MRQRLPRRIRITLRDITSKRSTVTRVRFWTNESNAVLFYNLGNAWFRKGDPGRAILQYERALALDRQHPEAQANLHLVRDEARALELPKTRADRYLGFATSDQYVWTAAFAFWIAIFALAVLLLGSRRSGATIAVWWARCWCSGEQLRLLCGRQWASGSRGRDCHREKYLRRDSQPPTPPGRFSPCPRAAK